MLTIFTTLKSLSGETKTIQLNALRNWRKLDESIEIIIFNEGEVFEEISESIGARLLSPPYRPESNLPIFDEMLSECRRISNYETLMYSNGDILFSRSLNKTISSCQAHFKNNPFLIAGRRIDLDVKSEIVFSENWEKRLVADAQISGQLHGYSGIDFFIFNRSLDLNIGGLVIGRPGWDNFLLSTALKKGIPVIDATSSITAIHQNHASAYTLKDKDTTQNYSLTNGQGNLSSLRNATWYMNNGTPERIPLLREIKRKMLESSLCKQLLSIKRKTHIYLKSS